jgi:DNA-binding response OmpR family regulator
MMRGRLGRGVKMIVSKRVLIVDDDKAVGGCFLAALEREDMKVDCAFNALDAMALIEEFDYDLIILDYRLPDISGEEFLQEAALEKTKTKVLLVTGYLTREMVVDMFKLGICGYMSKPVGSEELVYNVNFHLNTTKPSEYIT